MQLHLVSHKTCPSLQRAVLILREKQVDYCITYIDPLDPARPPVHDSAFRESMVLHLGDQALADPRAICEYLEEAFPVPALMPVDLVERARAREWLSYSEDILFNRLQTLLIANDESSFGRNRRELDDGLAKVEAQMRGRVWLTGDGKRFGMADVAVAPVFVRTSLLKTWFSLDLLHGHVNVSALAERLLARASAQASVPPDFQDAMLAGIQSGGGFLNTLS